MAVTTVRKRLHHSVFRPGMSATGFKFLFVKPGILRRIAGDWLRFWRRDFHPWHIDNRDLIREWEAAQSPVGDIEAPPVRAASR